MTYLLFDCLLLLQQDHHPVEVDAELLRVVLCSRSLHLRRLLNPIDLVGRGEAVQALQVRTPVGEELAPVRRHRILRVLRIFFDDIRGVLQDLFANNMDIVLDQQPGELSLRTG